MVLLPPRQMARCEVATPCVGLVGRGGAAWILVVELRRFALGCCLRLHRRDVTRESVLCHRRKDCTALQHCTGCMRTLTFEILPLYHGAARSARFIQHTLMTMALLFRHLGRSGHHHACHGFRAACIGGDGRRARVIALFGPWFGRDEVMIYM